MTEKVTTPPQLVNFLETMHHHRDWPAVVKFINDKYPKISRYDGDEKSVERFKRLSHQQEGWDSLMHMLGVPKR